MKRRLQRRRVLLGGLLLVSAQAIPKVSTGDGELPQGWQQPFPQDFPQLYLWRDVCNVWVIREQESALLICFGDGSIMPSLESLGIRRIERILLPDHHREQYQGLYRLPQLPAPVTVPQSELSLFSEPGKYRRWRPTLGDEYSVYGASYVRPTPQPIVVEGAADGAVLEWQGHELRCLATPGHSPGGLTFLISSGGLKFAFSGGFMYDGAKLSRWYDSEWDYGFGKGIDTLLSSAARLQTARPDVLLPAYGPVIRDAGRQLSEFQQRLVKFRASYVRGYPVFDSTPEERDSISTPTAVPLISRVTPHLYKLSHQTQGRNFAIIVSDNGHGLVLDCGLLPAAQLEEIIAGMRAHLGLKQIDAFWISHMHGDHFLLGPMLKEQYGAEAWTLDSIVDRCENPRAYDYAAMVSAYSDGFDGMKIDRAIRPGERIEWEGLTLQVDWMPGQTEFGCCLWLELDGQRIAFTGDNLFGNPQSPEQDGHEAVVARNSCILQEGYLYGAEYLRKLKPDILMGSHSYVMHNPAAFIDRYYNWAKTMMGLYREMLPEGSSEYGYDPYWVSAYPYRVNLWQQEQAEVLVTIRNFRDRPQRHSIRLHLPAGISAEPSLLEGELPARGRVQVPVKLRVNRSLADQAQSTVLFDITLDGQRYGDLFDFMLRTQPE
jgi:glyoxylase-like metal-dependent hydrolase (beta-lactamase superfamily II)